MERIKLNVGDKIGVLTIIKQLPRKNKIFMYLVKCDCGYIKPLDKANIIKHSNKCQCSRYLRNGLSRHPLYCVWKEMLRRCYDKNSHGYKWYGEKGIVVCDEWKDEKFGFVNFYNWAIKNGYKNEKLQSGKNKYTIDRIDSNKEYCPNNCRWVDYETQITNIKKLCTNKSGYVGVAWSKQERKWICYISINNHSKRIGGFLTQKEAVEKRNEFIDKNNLKHQKNVYIGELSNGY